MPAITAEVYSSMGLTQSEFELICKLLDREPSYTELGMFAVMWSEHCGYKFSRPVLAYFKRYKEALEGEGFENAGVVEIGDGLGVTMKVESHNHPSAVEPYQGAATGVGGIIRDILTMGARPIASLNSLRFGPIRDGEGEQAVIERNRYLFEHVVSGIAGYGNCVGVPTVAGEVGFHPRYSGNPLVNAMCVGILRTDEITTAAASGEGNPVIYLGSATGKDGVHGATFASTELDEESESKRPNVQIGDPFAEKQLIEATLEALRTGAIVGIQDMGAAGLTCSTVEMSSKGSVGMNIDLDLVPMREDDMTGYELMLSESQERMLAVAEKGREHEVIDVFQKWGLKAAVIGYVTNDGILTVTRQGEVVAKVDPKLLTDHCPVYQSPMEEPLYYRNAASFDIGLVSQADPQGALLTLLGTPEIASKRWVYQQYDQHVQTQTALECGRGDAAVIAPRGTKKGIALKIDGNSRQTYLHPYFGGQLAVAEAARNVACTGAAPQAVTDGLNFGSPQSAHVYWQFNHAVKGIADAAEAMGTPVISGNVSFYNESDLGEVPPTPLIGMLGILEDAASRLPLVSSDPEASLLLVSVTDLGITHDGLGASAYLAYVAGQEDGHPVGPNLSGEVSLDKFLVEAAATKSILSAHDLSEGGIAVTLAEMAMEANLGIEVELNGSGFVYSERVDAKLFGELPGRVVVSVKAGQEDAVVLMAKSFGLAAQRLGKMSASGSLSIRVGDQSCSWSVSQLQEVFNTSIEKVVTHQNRIETAG
ncbi:MAG: phosphoribosylformylglycinamidine synthase subunit PurL [Armatimonadetes bacterium]|nr:phosphoribosylformylglycinamidine synthase subunit PurL [Armatimonadota bacterium]